MSKDKIKKEEIPLESKVENLARNVFNMMNQYKHFSSAIDNVYIQVCTLIEILAKKDIINEKIWEETLIEVTTNLKEQIERMSKNESGIDRQDNVEDTNGPDAKERGSKIITPNSRIIIPGQN